MRKPRHSLGQVADSLFLLKQEITGISFVMRALKEGHEQLRDKLNSDRQVLEAARIMAQGAKDIQTAFGQTRTYLTHWLENYERILDMDRAELRSAARKTTDQKRKRRK